MQICIAYPCTSFCLALYILSTMADCAWNVQYNDNDINDDDNVK